MKDSVLSFLENCWLLLESIAPYILIGIFLAALMKLLISDEWIRRQIGGKDIKSLFKAILLGIPLPLCSCSAIPFAAALRKSGASKASTMSFFIATPITGLDSIAATYGVFGWFFTIYRVITSILIAFLAGILSLLFDSEESKSELLKPKVSASAVSSFSPTQAPSSLTTSTVFIKQPINPSFTINQTPQCVDINSFSYNLSGLYSNLATFNWDFGGATTTTPTTTESPNNITYNNAIFRLTNCIFYLMIKNRNFIILKFKKSIS